MKALVLASLVLCSSDLSAAPTRTVGSVLSANRVAMGNEPSAGTLRLDFAYSSNGLNGTLDQYSDLGSGAFTDRFDLGIISGANGFDMHVPWQTDVSGVSTDQEGGDRIPVAVNEAYRRSNLWWRRDRGGAGVSYVSRDRVHGRLADHLAVIPRNGKRFDAWFDADTHFLVQTAEPQQFFHVVTSYGAYRRRNGVMMATQRTINFSSGSVDKLTLRQASLGPVSPVSTYARRQNTIAGGQISGGVHSATLPFRLLNNHVYVQGMVNGHGPYTFIVDSGGHTLLSPKLAAEVGLKVTGEGLSTGAGSGSSKTGYSRYREISLGAVRMTDQPAFITNIYDKSIEGIDVDGMIGFELFARFAVTLDYGAQKMTITEFPAFDPSGLGTPVAFKFYDHLPSISGLIDRLPARFDIDTGSRSEINITSPFVASEKLRDRYRPGISMITGWGAGGASRSYAVRLPSLALGPVTAESVVAALSEDNGGSMSDPNFEGNIGSGLLKRFVVSFDYSRQIMYLKPLNPQPRDAGGFDRSGLWINAADGSFKVADVGKGSPAEIAGVRTGDLIVAIDGRAARGDDLSDARMLLRSLPPGTRVKLTLTRGGQELTADLVLRDLI